MDRQPDSYYDRLPDRLGDSLSSEQYAKVKELGLLADKDDQGVLLQIFTKPVGDRPTLFLEIIQVILSCSFASFCLVLLNILLYFPITYQYSIL